MCSVLEELCTSVLDAHTLGTPEVASKVGGIPEAVDHGAAIRRPRDGAEKPAPGTWRAGLRPASAAEPRPPRGRAVTGHGGAEEGQIFGGRRFVGAAILWPRNGAEGPAPSENGDRGHTLEGGAPSRQRGAPSTGARGNRT